MGTLIADVKAYGPAVISGAIFFLGAFLDAATTNALITMPGLTEMNPIINTTHQYTGLLGIVVMKLVLFGVMVGIILKVYPPKHHHRGLLVSEIVIGLIWLAAGVWNLSLIVG